MARYVSARDRVQIRPMSPSGASRVPTAQPCSSPWATSANATCSPSEGAADEARATAAMVLSSNLD